MYPGNRDQLRSQYLKARDKLIADEAIIIELERFLAFKLSEILGQNYAQIKHDYDSGSELYPFWQTYPPQERGRKPIGDQFPWIEVGEHAVGTWLAMNLNKYFNVENLTLPTGPDQRFVVSHPGIATATKGLTSSAWLMIDIKSAGPRDDARHSVMSHNQVSGSGEWNSASSGIENGSLVAVGKRKSHDFLPTLPPLVIDKAGRILPVVTMALKPVYKMESNQPVTIDWRGQPMSRLDLATIPNGLLLCMNPQYVIKHPGLLFPGKDDKSVPLLKRRARVSFELLEKIAAWRHRVIDA